MITLVNDVVQGFQYSCNAQNELLQVIWNLRNILYM